MSTNQNKKNMCRLMIDLFVKGDMKVIDERVKPNFIEHSAALGMPTGVEGLKAIAKMIRDGFPDFNIIVEDQVAEGDRVVLRFTEEGIHRGQVFGIPPSGKQARWSAIH